MQYSPPEMLSLEQCDNKCCICNSKFTLLDSLMPWKLTKRHCYNCGLYCCTECIASYEPLPKFHLLKPVPLCLWCDLFVHLKAKIENMVHHVSVPELKLYLGLYGISSDGLLEKNELVEIILKLTPSNALEKRYRRSIAVLAAHAAPLLRHWKDVHEVFTVSSLVAHVHSAVLEKLKAKAPLKTARHQNSTFSSSDSTRANFSSNSASQRSAAEAVSSASPAGKSTTQVYLYSLAEITAKKIKISSLSVKQLRYLLLTEGVSVSNVLEKSELTSKAQILFDSQETAEAAPPSGSLKDDRLCKVCFENPSNSVLLDCGHVVMCFSCAQEVFKTSRTCPICRSPIIRILRTFNV